MFGKPCAVCAEKDKRIEDLREQVQYLRGVLNPPAKATTYEEPQNFQADVILSGGGEEETLLPQDENLESPEVLAERAAMLSGTY